MTKNDSSRKKPGRASAATLTACVVAALASATAGAAVNVLNPTGGVTGTDGLRIHTENGRFQIVRAGLKQIYQEKDVRFATNFTPGTLGFALFADGAKLVMAYPGTGETGGAQWAFFSGPSPLIEWTSGTNTLTNPDVGIWRNVEEFTATYNSRSYAMTITTDYTVPNSFAEVTVSLTLPLGLSSDPQLYLVSDFYLDGGDSGPTATALVGDRRYVVQTRNGAVGGYLESDGTANTFLSYLAGTYLFGYGGYQDTCYGPCNGTSYPNTASPAFDDSGVASHWALSKPTTLAEAVQVRKVKLFFSNSLPGPDLVATTTAITAINPSPVLTGATYTVSGTVSINDTTGGVPSTLPGRVDVTAQGEAFCTDSDGLTATATIGQYAFSCSAASGDPGEYTMAATYTDTSDPQVYDTSDAEDEQVVSSPPPIQCGSFFAPVDRRPTVNQANAGRVIPLKWRCTNEGVPVTSIPDEFRVSTTACVNGAGSASTLDAIEEYASGSSGLINQGNGYWQFNWATPKSYANSCKAVTVTFDGAQIGADFTFKR